MHAYFHPPDIHANQRKMSEDDDQDGEGYNSHDNRSDSIYSRGDDGGGQTSESKRLNFNFSNEPADHIARYYNSSSSQ